MGFVRRTILNGQVLFGSHVSLITADEALPKAAWDHKFVGYLRMDFQVRCDWKKRSVCDRVTTEAEPTIFVLRREELDLLITAQLHTLRFIADKLVPQLIVEKQQACICRHCWWWKLKQGRREILRVRARFCVWKLLNINDNIVNQCSLSKDHFVECGIAVLSKS